MERGIETKCIYGDGAKFEGEQTGSISFPIYQTATFAHPAVGQSTGYDYSRMQNPTRQQLEQVVASLEGGVDALAFSSGMAAMTALMELFRPGDHIITDADLYGGSIRLFRSI
ncbi:MAG: PLP-dependent aspartate aminotransferase family protein, partial [Clostridiales bacterium]|nr:PLP-dependent aspartate aminotransferase family protein [Clostridiales bacterium]